MSENTIVKNAAIHLYTQTTSMEKDKRYRIAIMT